MNKLDLNHHIINLIERLRIMHKLAKEQEYGEISKEEMLKDLEHTLNDLKKYFNKLVQ